MAPSKTADKPEVVVWEQAFGSLVKSDDLMDPAQVQIDIATRILAAASYDEALAMGEAAALKVEDICGRDFYIIDVPEWYRSDKGGTNFFVVLPIRFANHDREAPGASAVVTVGGANVLAQLRKGQEVGAFPSTIPHQFKSVHTASGFDTYWLKRGEDSL